MSAVFQVQPITDFTIFTTPASQRRGVNFKASWSTTVDELEYELVHLGAHDVILEIGVDAKHIRLDGQLRANAQPEHPGVRLSFQTRKHGTLSYTCDTYSRAYGWQMPSWQANVRAIVKTLGALRDLDRWGATKGEQYAGFKALGAGSGATPLGGMTRDQALAVLAEHGTSFSVSPEHLNTSPDSLRHTYRRARAHAHPDHNDGSRELWDQVERAGRVLGVAR